MLRIVLGTYNMHIGYLYLPVHTKFSWLLLANNTVPAYATRYLASDTTYAVQYSVMFVQQRLLHVHLYMLRVIHVLRCKTL